jgi:hypothetical protein
MVQPSDIYVLAGLVAVDEPWTYRSLAVQLGVSHPLVQRALERARDAGLYLFERRVPHLANIEEFALHGLRFVAPGHLGEVVPGVPTAWAAPPVSDVIATGEDLPPVWPTADGPVRGQALEPLHRAAPHVAPALPALAQLLAVLDSLRTGDARVRTAAGELLPSLLASRPAGSP